MKLAPVLFSFIITSVCLFLSSGRLDWTNAWVLLAINFAASASSSLLMARNPELLAERSNVKAGKSSDKLLVGVTVLLGPVATWVTAGLDTRFHWSAALPFSTFLVGVVVAACAAALVAWSMSSNRFFSAVLRIQKDRGHFVVTTGPYRYVRHPGYAGMAIFTLVTPLVLNSRWALLPAAITAAFVALRTALEDRTLQAELDGYSAYAGTVRYRLVPLLW